MFLYPMASLSPLYNFGKETKRVSVKWPRTKSRFASNTLDGANTGCNNLLRSCNGQFLAIPGRSLGDKRSDVDVHWSVHIAPCCDHPGASRRLTLCPLPAMTSARPFWCTLSQTVYLSQIPQCLSFTLGYLITMLSKSIIVVAGSLIFASGATTPGVRVNNFYFYVPIHK